MIALYHDSAYYEKRSTEQFLRQLAMDLEEARLKPPITPDQFQMMDVVTQSPIACEVENGQPILRSAGRDKLFNTRDDITQIVNIGRTRN